MSKKFSIGGNSEEFEFEHRLFNHLCVYSMLACVLSFSANWLIGLAWQLNLVIAILFLYFAYLYYSTRFSKKYRRAIIPYHFAVIVFLSLMWFFNGGIQGPIGYFYFIAISGVMIFLRTYKIAIVLILLHIIALITIDYFFHFLITPYQDRFSQYIDIMVGICTVSGLLGLGIHRLKQNYDFEHNRVEEQKQELVKLNQVQSKLISVISHDVRAPFNSLKGTLNLLKSDALTKEETMMLAGNLSYEVDNALSLVNNLLYWSQTQLQGINPKVEPFDMMSVIEETLKLVSPQASKKSIQFQTSFVGNILENAALVNATLVNATLVNADKEMMKTVLRNLVTNAIKFSYRESIIEINLQKVDNKLIVGILDSGVGLSPTQKEGLFNPIHGSTLGTADEKGNGIGLALCKDFVEKNGGRIWVESNEGKGSKFYFSVPLQITWHL